MVAASAAIANSVNEAAGSDEKTVAPVTEFYQDSNNNPIVIPHAIDIIAVRIKGTAAQELAQTTGMYLLMDNAGTH